MSFNFTLLDYTVREDMGSVPVIVTVSNGIFSRAITITVNPSDSQATGNYNYEVMEY